MLRISFSADDSSGTIRLDGKLLKPWIGEVRSTVALAGGGGTARIDLRGLTFADPDGIDLLRELDATGVRLEGASPFIAELLANSVRHIR